MFRKIIDKFNGNGPVIINNGTLTSAANTQVQEKKLSDILKDKHSEEYSNLIIFLASEFSVENIFFLALCDGYHNDPSIEELSFIYLNYIKANSAFQVNISSQQLEKIEKSYEQINQSHIQQHQQARFRSNAVTSRAEAIMPRTAYIPHNVFDAARLEIFKLIERDSFARFMKINSFTPTESISAEIKKQRDPIFKSGIRLPSAFYMQLTS